MESRQHFICTKAVPIFVFSMTSRQHFICTEVAPTLAFIMELEVSRRMPPRLWHCKELSLRFWRCKEMPTKPWSFKKNVAKTLTLHGHATPTSDAGGRWHCPNFGDMMWNNTTQKEDDVIQISELWSDTTSKIWENIHRRWAMPWRLHFLQKKLEILFYSTTKHQVMFSKRY